MVSICVKSSVFGDGQAHANLPEVTLQLVSERVSLAEIIGRAVREQIATLTRRHHKQYKRIAAQLRRQYLAAADVSDQVRHGKVAMANTLTEDPGQLDVDAEIALALQAFSKARFRVYVDGEPITDLDQQFTVTDASRITFLRLVPLVGG